MKGLGPDSVHSRAPIPRCRCCGCSRRSTGGRGPDDPLSRFCVTCRVKARRAHASTGVHELDWLRKRRLRRLRKEGRS